MAISSAFKSNQNRNNQVYEITQPILVVTDKIIKRLCTVKSKLINRIPDNTNPTVHTPTCFMTLLEANTLNLRAIKSKSFMSA